MAFNAYTSFATSEDVAQVATSCRRFLIALADTLDPPKRQIPCGLKLGPAGYRYRLRQSIKGTAADTPGAPILGSHDDVGRRIDRLHNLTT
jgi:hypothetical protein